jgi:Cytochrome C''.
MKPLSHALGVIAMLAAASEVHSATVSRDLHDLMKNVVATQTQVIWDVGNRAQDDQGNPDASKLAADDWSKLIDAAGKVRQVAQTLAQSEHILVAAAGVKIDGEGTADARSAKQVQATMDANPKEFQALSQALVTSMDQVVGAAKAKDAAKVFDVSGALDQVCENCHVKFWYPQQTATQ